MLHGEETEVKNIHFGHKFWTEENGQVYARLRPNDELIKIEQFFSRSKKYPPKGDFPVIAISSDMKIAVFSPSKQVKAFGD